MLAGRHRGITCVRQVSIPPLQRAEYESLVATLRDVLGNGALAASWQRGHVMTAEQAVATAREDQEARGPRVVSQRHYGGASSRVLRSDGCQPSRPRVACDV